ncbi:MAG TPA: hypothetical protein PLP34_09230 [Chitinophagaceae bacterium]|nr:hypothetical protein [Chitinophagaceae bacterium]
METTRKRFMAAVAILSVCCAFSFSSCGEEKKAEEAPATEAPAPAAEAPAAAPMDSAAAPAAGMDSAGTRPVEESKPPKN